MIQVAAAFALLYFGRDIFIPVSMAFVFSTMLRPVVKRLEGWRIPAPAAAGLIVLTGLLLLWAAGYALSLPAENFRKQLPQLASDAGVKLRTLPRPLNRIGEMLPLRIDSVAALAGDTTPLAADSARARGDSNSSRAKGSRRAGSKPAAPQGGDAAGNGSNSSSGTSSGMMSFAGKVFGTATDVISTAVEIILLLLFFLAVGDEVHGRLAKSRSALAHAIVDVTDEVGSIVSRYLTLLTLINMVQGTVIGVAMALIGMPVPPVLGAMAFVAEFFPYLGGLSMVVLLTLVGVARSSGGNVLLAPAIYLFVTTIQNSVVSPVTYGRSLKLNPAAILISVMVWWMLWGVLGAFLAVPILATIRVVCDRQKGQLAALAALIEG